MAEKYIVKNNQLVAARNRLFFRNAAPGFRQEELTQMQGTANAGVVNQNPQLGNLPVDGPKPAITPMPGASALGVDTKILVIGGVVIVGLMVGAYFLTRKKAA